MGNEPKGTGGIACVILNYNDAPTALKLLNRIESYPCLDWIVVVDNHSTDGSWEMLENWIEKRDGSRFFLLKAKENGGYGKGNNLGIHFAVSRLGADFVVVSNPDVEFSPQCVYDMKDALEREPEAAVVSAMVKSPEGKALFSCWKLSGLLGDLLDTGLISRRIFKSILNYSPRYLAKRPFVEVGAVCGSLFMADASILKNGSMKRFFDEGVFLYCEEKILGQKLKRLGKKTLLLTGTSYVHAHSTTIDKTVGSIAPKQRLLHKSKLYYYRKYLKSGPVGMAFARLFLTVVMGEVYFLTKVCRLKW